MMELRVEDCTNEAFKLIAPLLREEDIEEWRLFAGGSPAHLIRDGYKLPEGPDAINRIGYDKRTGKPLLVWGVSSHDPKKPNSPGWVWLVATPEAVRHHRSIHQHLKGEFHDKIVGKYPRLITASWEQNAKHHEWLRWLGFEQAFVSIPMGVHGAPFIPFTYNRSKDHK